MVFNVPVRYLLHGGLAGLAGWFIFRTLGGTNTAIFLAAVAIGLIAETGARLFHIPVLIIAVPGTIPLVPGFGAYLTMLALVKGDYLGALAKGTETLFAAGAIAVGIAVATVPFRMLKRGRLDVRKVAPVHSAGTNPPKR